MENYLGERLVADALPQHDPTIQRHLGHLISSNTARERVTYHPLLVIEAIDIVLRRH